MAKGNPQHPVTKMMAHEWHKVAALIMQVQGITEIEITSDAIETFQKSKMNIVVDCRGGRLIIRLLDDDAAVELMRREGDSN